MDGHVEQSMDAASEAEMDKTDKLVKPCKSSKQVVTEISGRTQENTTEGSANTNGVDQHDLIQQIVGLIDQVKLSNAGLEHTTDAQYKFIQNLVNKQTKEAEKERAKPSGGWIFGSKSKSKDTEVHLEDLTVNQMEIQTLASHQNAILSQTRAIDATIGDLYCKLKASLPRLFVSVTEPLPTKKVHLPSSWDKTKEKDISKKNLDVKVATSGTSVDANHKREQERRSIDRPNDCNDILKENEDSIKKLEDMKGILKAKNELCEHLQQQFKETTSELYESNEVCFEMRKEIKSLNSEITEWTRSYGNLNQQYQDILCEKEELSKEISDLKDHKSRLEGIKQELGEKIHEYNLLKKKYRESELEKEYFSKENLQLNERISSLEIDLENKHRESRDLLRKIEEENSLVTDLNIKLKEGDKVCNELAVRADGLSQKIDHLQSIKKDMTEKIKTSDSTIIDLQAELKSKDSELQNRAFSIKSLEDDLKRTSLELQEASRDAKIWTKKAHNKTMDNKKLTEINSRLKDQLFELEHKSSKLKLELKEAVTQIKSMNVELDKLRKWKREYDDELERQRMRKKAILYIPRRGDLVNMVVSEMSARLDSLFEQNKSGLEFEEVDSVSRIKPNTPVLVFCINASRLGTDVSNALTGIRVSPQIAVVVLHHKEQHALPNQSSERVLTSTEYKSIGGIFDMACLSSKGGLYECDMNTTAIRGLYEFIKQRNTQ